MASQNNQVDSDQSNGQAEVVRQIKHTLTQLLQDQDRINSRVAQLDYSLQKEREINATLA